MLYYWLESLAEETPVAPAVTEFMGPLEGMMTEPPGAAAGAAETGTAPPGATRALTGAATAGGGGAPVGPGGGPPEDIAVRPAGLSSEVKELPSESPPRSPRSLSFSGCCLQASVARNAT